MPQPPSLGPAVPEILLLWIGTAAAAWAVYGVVAVFALAVDRTGRWNSLRRREGAVEAFAAAAVRGDLARAESEARRAFGEVARDKAPRDKAPRDKAPRDKAPRDKAARDSDKLTALTPPGVATWDEWVEVECTFAEVVARLRGPRDVARWFTAFHRAEQPEGAQVIVGRFPLRVTEEWVGNGMSYQAEGPDGSRFGGHLTFRAVLLPRRGSRADRQGVEVWVHAEAPASRRGRQILRTARSATRDGLRLMAADLAR